MARTSCVMELCAIITCLVVVATGVCGTRSNEGAGRPYDVMSEANPSVFDGLTAKEIHEVADYLRGQGLHTDTSTVTSSYVFALDRLTPPKDETLGYLDKGAAMPERFARVILYRGDLNPPMIQEYKVGPLTDVTSHTQITSPGWMSAMPYSLRNLESPTECASLDAFLYREMTKINHILKEVTGFTYAKNCSENCLEDVPGQPGQFESGARKPWFFLFRKYEGFCLHPVGFQFRINAEPLRWEDWSIDYIWFRGQSFADIDQLKAYYYRVKSYLTVEKPLHFDPDDVNLYSSLNHRGDFDPPASEKRGPATYMPDGPRYELDGHHVKWQGWEFDFSMQTVKGLRVNDIRFQGHRIAYEISIAEVAVIYSGATPAPAHSAFLDSQYLLGLQTLELFPGVDCPEYATYFDFAHFLAYKPAIFRNSVCLFEWNKGIPLRRHTENNFAGSYHFWHGMADNALILRTILTVSNYDYITDFTFHQNGVLEVTDSLSGYILSSFYTGSQNDKYGFKVLPQAAGQIHNHFINFKVDLDVIDQSNRFETLDIHIEEKDDLTEKGQKIKAQVFDRNLKEREREAAYKFHFETPKYLIFHNAKSSNAYGNQRGYRLVPAAMTKQLLPEMWKVENGFSWARYQVAVTKRKEEEFSSSTVYNDGNMIDPILYFQSFIDDNENIVDEDLVAWVTLGTFHIPRSEDIPIVQTPGVQLSFFLQPFNFFDEDPSLASRDNVRATPKQDGSGHNMQYASGSVSLYHESLLCGLLILFLAVL